MRIAKCRGRWIWQAIILVAFLGAFAQPAICDPVPANVFGPETFVRGSGNPQIVSREISLTGFTGPYVLHVQNGDENGEHRASSAEVWLHENRILGPSDFSQQFEEKSIEIEIADPSNLVVWIASQPGSNLTIRIEGLKLDPNERIVGPEGGMFTFPNGVVLNVPAGAVTDDIPIRITDFPCEEVDQILSARIIASHEERCIGAFSAEPSGLVFKIPIKAVIPVLPLGPGEIPLEINFNPVSQTYSVAKTDAVYRGDLGEVEIAVEHFTEEVIVGSRSRLYVTAPENLPACCNENPIRPDCCCIQVHTESAASDVAFDFPGIANCGISGSTTTTTYNLCPGSPVAHDEQSEISSGCPGIESARLIVFPSLDHLKFCEQETFSSEIEFLNDQGGLVFNTPIPSTWTLEPSGTNIASITENFGTVTKVVAGENVGSVNVKATSPDPRWFDTSPVTVEPNNASVSIYQVGDSFSLSVGDQETIWAACDGCEFNSPFTWSISGSAVSISPTTGGNTTVTGVTEGQASIHATTTDKCGRPVEGVTVATVHPLPPPEDFNLEAKIEDCGWNASYCEFESLSGPVALTVRTGQEGVSIAVSANATVSPASGVTDGSGEFQTSISGVQRERPYIIAYISAWNATSRKTTEARAITKDICFAAEGASYGSKVYDPVYSIYTAGQVTEDINFDASLGQFSGSVSVSVIGSGEIGLSQWGEWWDTGLAIPSDLRLLGQRTILTGSLNTSSSGDSSGSGETLYSGAAGVWGLALGASGSCGTAAMVSANYCGTDYCASTPHECINPSIFIDWINFGTLFHYFEQAGVNAYARASQYVKPGSPPITFFSQAEAHATLSHSWGGLSAAGGTVFFCSGQ